MKKFWNLMLAALVIIGATACTENYDGIEKAQNTEGFSFYAEVVNDGTRAYIDNEDGDKTWNTVWENGDKLIVKVAEAEFGGGGSFQVEFKCEDAAKGQFVSYDSNAAYLQGQNVTITTEGNHHSLQGKKAFYTNTVVNGFDNTKPIQLEAHTSFFRYTYNGEGEVKLTLSEPAFRAENGTATNEVTISGYGEHFVAFWPTGEEVTLSYSVNGEIIRTTTKAFVAGKVYNLGTLVAAEPYDIFGIVGGHQGWDSANPDAMYLIPGSNTYVRYNVPINADGFKFYGETSKMVTVEHPAVTTGETGDYYLVPNSNWTKDGARFAIYFFGNGETWVSMKDGNGDGVYVGNKPTNGKTYPSMIFCRMNPNATANNWNNKWNQTADLTCPSDGTNCYTVKAGTWDKGGGTWSVHTPEVKDAWTEEVEEITSYWVGMKAGSNIDNWVTGWSNSIGENGPNNIMVSDTNKTYDIYFHKGDDQDWGFEYHFVVLESGSAQPELK